MRRAKGKKKSGNKSAYMQMLSNEPIKGLSSGEKTGAPQIKSNKVKSIFAR